MAKNTNIVRITIPNSKFFRYWFECMYPFHKQPARYMDVFASFLKYRFDLAKVIKDEDILNNVLFSDDIKKKIRADCKISQQHFQVIMSALRKAGLVENNKINKKYIPNIEEDGKEFRLIFHFELQ